MSPHRARRTSEQRATCFDGPKTSTFDPGAPLTGCSDLGNPPREGRDPGEDRGAFRPFDRTTHARVESEDPCEVSLVDVCHLVVFGS